MLDKIRPVTKRIGMNRMIAQATGTLHGGREIVQNAAMQFHPALLAQNLPDTRMLSVGEGRLGSIAVMAEMGGKRSFRGVVI